MKQITRRELALAGRGPVTREVTRRELVRILGLAAAAFSLIPGCGETSSGSGETTDGGVENTGVDDLPTLGGAPATDQGRTIAAFVDTVIPGMHRDPAGAPGGVDTGVPGAFFDPTLPAAGLVGVLALVLSSTTGAMFGSDRSFFSVKPDEREQVLEKALAEVPAMEFAVLFAKVSFLGTQQAADHLGYPGPNPGYRHHPEFSFGKAMSDELTADGNLG